MALLSLAKTADQAIYEDTCLDLIRELSKGLAEDKPTKESFTSINGPDKAVQEINFTTTIHNLFKKYHNPTITYPSSKKSTERVKLFKYFLNDMEIMKIGNHNMSINQAMKIAGNLYQEVGTEFYGMLLTTKGRRKERTIFNPLHPIMVAELKKEDSNFDLDKKEWSISVYSFKGNTSKRYNDLRNNVNYIDEIATIVTSINSPSNYIIENSNFNVDIVDDRFVLNYKETKKERKSGNLIESMDSSARNYVVPSQIINIKGVAYPYYGTIYSRKGLAWNLTPMYHANINHPNAQSESNGMEGGSRICTHSGNSKTQKGISSLNHCNTTSPLNSMLLTDGAISYAEQSLRASLEMFLGDAFIEHGAMEARVLTYQEFLTENGDNGTRKLYLRYLKDRLNRKMDQKPDEVVVKPVVAEPYGTGANRVQQGDEDGITEIPVDTARPVDPEQVWTEGYVYNIGNIVSHDGYTYRATVDALQIEPTMLGELWELVPQNERGVA